MVLAFDFRGSGHSLARLDRFGELGLNIAYMPAVAIEHSPLASDDGRQTRHRHHAVTHGLRHAENLRSRRPLKIRMYWIHIERGKRVAVDCLLMIVLDKRRENEVRVDLRKER